ncbi:RNA 2',3'-cyclic phosphodiesterase [Dactylosporangium aurantiacum]|uniref:RNA 2',3'-cyclic phosphodiesterase n=1 Tax=Dactylosporangium aurantiacum TaxID=35754 RepID=A0A9Q9IHN3_9ACTN|nr:RNA 2',3'-cyclic phosphodiesterase [Dactylosporangium aurantiacum]MDG6107549.1 RNA 2',3'-cyclic phosphodiesterase [Dactylosporangium aurantiacum]UWZ54335.1 RNA 2',3'-cyclic phosphodiesterase [Dactylosporangium aurantiacum]
MRLFIAAYLPAAAERDFARLVGTLAVARPMPEGRSLRLAPAEQWHMTLAFLGEVDDARQDDAVEVMDAVPVDRPVVRIAGGGTFGRGKFTTLVAKVDGDVAPLGDTVRRLLKRRRLPFDRRPLQPHVTIARPGDRLPAVDVAADLEVLRGYRGPEWAVDDIRLMKSELGPRPTYEVLATARTGQ